MPMVEPRKLVAESLGAFGLVFIGAGSIIVGTGGLIGVALAHGLAIALLVSALGHISGGLFNPALTIGFWVTKQLDTVHTVAYIISQLIGGVLGAVALLLLFPEAMREASALGTPLLTSGVTVVQGVGIEAILTAFLMLAVFGTAVDKRGPAVGGFGIGLVITMDILAGGPLTGAAMNPARALGPALISGEWTNHLVYWIGPIIGAVLAALLYTQVLADPDSGEKMDATEESEAAEDMA